MQDYEQDTVGGGFNGQSLLQSIRAISAVLGIVAIIIGLVYTTRVFALVFDALQAPDSFEGYLAKWAAAVGGEQLDIVIAGTTYPCASLIAIMILGGGVVILAWLAMGLVLVGAKTISWTLSDREAIKRILVHTFGPAGKPQPNKLSGGDDQ